MDTAEQAVVAASASRGGNLTVGAGDGNRRVATEGSAIAASVGIVAADTAEVACRIAASRTLLFVGIDAEAEICSNDIVSVPGGRTGTPGPGECLGQPVEISTGSQSRTVKAEHGGDIAPTGPGMAVQADGTGVGSEQ